MVDSKLIMKTELFVFGRIRDKSYFKVISLSWFRKIRSDV
jgi:hypothetical protein